MYETDLTDFQWQVIQEILPDTRRRKHSLRMIVNALLYLTKSGWGIIQNYAGGFLNRLVSRWRWGLFRAERRRTRRSSPSLDQR